MVSQPFMHRRFVPYSWIFGLATVLWLAPGCGQNEGGRCQVTSDCASGLSCEGGQTGNGVCRPRGFVGNADATVSDVPADQAAASGPEDGAPEVAVEVEPAVDAEPEASVGDAASAPDVEPLLDVEAVDTVGID